MVPGYERSTTPLKVPLALPTGLKTSLMTREKLSDAGRTPLGSGLTNESPLDTPGGMPDSVDAARARTYLAALEPDVRVNDLTDKELEGLVHAVRGDTTTWVRIETHWVDGSQEEWKDLNHSFTLGSTLPNSLLDELTNDVDRLNSDEHYRGCSIILAVPPIDVVEEEIRRKNAEFISCQKTLRRLDELLAKLVSQSA